MKLTEFHTSIITLAPVGGLSGTDGLLTGWGRLCGVTTTLHWRVRDETGQHR